ncbi:MAG: hypothetical protein WBE53_21350, partial [Pseudolabrys sp.]
LWVLGGPNEAFIAKEIAAAGGNRVRDLTSTDLRNAILALAAVLEPPGDEQSRERARAEGNNAVRHRRTDDVSVETVLTTVRRVLANAKKPAK